MTKRHFKSAHIRHYSGILIKSVLRTPILIYLALAGNFITFLTAYGFYLLEKGVNSNVENYFDALWWAFCTVSTVGYGDIAPETLGGRLIGIFLIIVGVAFFLCFLAVLSTVIGAVSQEQD